MKALASLIATAAIIGTLFAIMHASSTSTTSCSQYDYSCTTTGTGY